MPEGPAHDPSPILIAFAKGRLARTRHVVVLERNDGSIWREVGRFSDVGEADRALDEAVASGDPPDSLRVSETHVASNGVLVLAGVIAIALAIAIVAYVILS